MLWGNLYSWFAVVEERDDVQKVSQEATSTLCVCDEF